MPYQYDYFLSYSWEDDRRPISGLTAGWVDRFQHALEIELRELWWPRVEGFRDCERIKTGQIDPQVRQAVNSAVSFVALLSSSYFKSDWCVDEANRMVQAIRRDPLLTPERAMGRIIPVLLAPIRSDQLGDFAGILHVEAFIRTGTGPDEWRLLEPSDHGPGNQMVRRVALMVKDVLSQVRGVGGPLYGSNGRIYLGVSPDLGMIKSGLMATLQEHGFPVEPSASLPQSLQAFETAVSTYLSNSCAAIHALGRKAPKLDEGYTPVHREFELTRQSCANAILNLALAWIPDDWETANGTHRKFVTELERGTNLPDRLRVYRRPYHEFKEILKAACKGLGVTPPPPAQREGVYLVSRLVDEQHSHRIALDAWIESLGLKVYRPLFQGEASQIRAKDDLARASVRKVIIYCGVGSAGAAEAHYEVFRADGFGADDLIFYTTVELEDFAPDPVHATVLQAGTNFDAAFVDANLRPLLT